MKHFLGFCIAIFSILFLTYLYRDDQSGVSDSSSLKVYATSSFVGSWGPGPELKDLFEKQFGLKVSFIEMAETQMTLQKLSMEEGQSVGDVVLSLDQFDLVRYADKIKWLDFTPNRDFDLPPMIGQWKNVTSFTPYNFAPVTFVSRKVTGLELKNLNDLLKPEWKGLFALQDPRTSSLGLQFLFWIMKSYPETEAIEFIKKIKSQAHSVSNSWSASYGLFKEKHAQAVLSYATSPVYHLVEEKDSNYKSYEFADGNPVQVEFAGIPESCKNCESAKKFVTFLLSPAAQKVIMQKNYMLPVYRPAQEGTAFDTIKIFRLFTESQQNYRPPTKNDIQNWLNLWSEIPRSDSQ